MSIERTFSIIKPDAVERNKIGEITSMLESAGLRIVASKRIQLNQEKAAAQKAVSEKAAAEAKAAEEKAAAEKAAAEKAVAEAT